jgi:hypothetical protein
MRGSQGSLDAERATVCDFVSDFDGPIQSGLRVYTLTTSSFVKLI